MGARSKARKRALDVLFEADVVGADVRDTLQARLARNTPPVPAYAVELVEGVLERREEIDRLLSEHSRGWTLDRMPAVDRNILRIGAYELLWRDDVPDAVAISEAVELAVSLSTDESPKFVNGLLAALAGHRPAPAPAVGPLGYEPSEPQPAEAGAEDVAGLGSSEEVPGDPRPASRPT